MPQESTLLNFIAQRNTMGLEDVATDALFFILSRSNSTHNGVTLVNRRVWFGLFAGIHRSDSLFH